MKPRGRPQNKTINSDKNISKEVKNMGTAILEKPVQAEDNRTAQLENELNTKTQQYDALNTELQAMREMMKMLLANNTQQQSQPSSSALDNRVVIQG